MWFSLYSHYFFFFLFISRIEKITFEYKDPKIKLVPVIKEIGISTDWRPRNKILFLTELFCIPINKKISNDKLNMREFKFNKNNFLINLFFLILYLF